YEAQSLYPIQQPPKAKLRPGNRAFHVPTNGSSNLDETALHCPDRLRLLTFQDTNFASWCFCRSFRRIIGALRPLTQRFKSHHAPRKIKIDFEMLQVISTEDAALREP